MCALTRAVKPEAELIRFVAAPDGSVVPDIKAKLPGRGVWIGLDRGSVAQAARRNVFARSLKAPVRAAPDLADQLAALLRDAALGRLGLSRRAGGLVTGFMKVEATLACAQIAALLLAADAAEDGARKMAQAVHRNFPNGAPFPALRLFSSAELGLATGLPNVIHAAVLQGPAGKSFVEAALRLQRYEGVGGGAKDDRAGEPQGAMDE